MALLPPNMLKEQANGNNKMLVFCASGWIMNLAVLVRLNLKNGVSFVSERTSSCIKYKQWGITCYHFVLHRYILSKIFLYDFLDM